MYSDDTLSFVEGTANAPVDDAIDEEAVNQKYAYGDEQE